MKELALSLNVLEADEVGAAKILGKNSADVRTAGNLRNRFAKANGLSGDAKKRSNETDNVNGFVEPLVKALDSNGIFTADSENADEKDHDKKELLIKELTSVYNDRNMPEDIHKWNKEEQRSWLEKNLSVITHSVPKNLHYIFSSMFRPGDCGRSQLDKPDWLDMDKFRRGQKFARDHYFGVNYANILGLYQLFSFKEGIDPVIFTERSHTPYLSFKRYLSTALRIRNWYRFDPWQEGSPAYNDMVTVRRMHRALKRGFEENSNETIKKMCAIENPCCPLLNIMLRDFQSNVPEPSFDHCPYRFIQSLPNKPKGMNQGDMMATQFAFVGTVILYSENIGIHNATNEDLDAYCHTWRVIGYLLGIEDEYNFCRGSLEEVKKRARDFTEHWVKPNFHDISAEWEHMVRCLMEGIEYYFPAISFEVGLLHLADCLHLDMQRVTASLDYLSWIVLHASRWFLRYACKSQIIATFINKRLNLALDTAANFSPKKHAELQEKSIKRMEVLRSAIHT